MRIAELADMLGKAEPCEYVRIIGSDFWRPFCAIAVSPQAEKTKRDKKATEKTTVIRRKCVLIRLELNLDITIPPDRCICEQYICPEK
jgi:hypothetical protein